MQYRHRIWESSISLMVAYESLALEYSRARTRRDISASSVPEEYSREQTTDYSNYHHSFALLVLNASVIEGTLRSILSATLSDEIESMTIAGKKAGKSKPSKAEELLYEFREEVELKGGWENLKKQYAFYFDISLDKVCSPDITEAVNALFVLRNILAHGTAIIQPFDELDDDEKDIYPYAWQRKIQRATVYLRSTFGKDDLFDNLAEYHLPEHFMDVTKAFFRTLKPQIGNLPERAEKTISMIDDYSFAKRNFA